ncbi:uncharacterized protein PGRI_085060 [Penicillium griseofulvum]|uniref:Myb-like domain-containing protein n=1 Tax=Penicillium patulum TaxID=5078 RepID=A0A135LTE2_PENPA|nr:uncharacterized protein PGRI_085060 [Penicillium griseofulvum]KXG52222.1 hypothetical protein PGRI_085060 [Penicillium griseofulvum]
MDVLAIPGAPKSWMAHPKEYTGLTDIMYAYASQLWSPDALDKPVSSSQDWYSILYPSTSNSRSDFHLLHHPSPTIDAQHPRESAPVMMNQNRLPGPPMPLMEDGGRFTPLRAEDPRLTGYSQSVSPSTTRLDLNSTLSSNGSTYCDSDIESLDHFDEPISACTMETHAGLVHPTPRSNMLTLPSNSFLSSTEETSSHSFSGVSNLPRDEQSLSNSQFGVANPNIANYPMGIPFNPHPQNTHLAPSIIPQDAKAVNYEEHISWPVCQPSNTTDIWFPTRDLNGSSEDSGWHAHNACSAPWPHNNAYACPTECNQPASHVYGMSSGPPMPSFGHAPVPLVSSAPISHQPYMPTYAPYVSTFEAPPRYHPTPQPTYPPSSQPVSPNTGSGSPGHRTANILGSPSSVSTNEDRSSQQSGEEQSGIETSLHYSDERNKFLIDCKRRGLSYKDIKRVGGFKEAESTLRGRYRTLTKSKEQRVRKPKWQDKDIQLLCQAVCIHAETHGAYHSMTSMNIHMNEPPKVSWKTVAEHIWDNGGSYHFGNATCKKKWCEINNITV